MSTPIVVNCRFHELVPVSKLVENPRNPNRHPLAQIEALAKLIETNGWRSPVVVSRRSGFIVKGHGRFEAAKRLATEVPVEFQDYTTEAEEWADMMADNRIAELAEIDVTSLHGLLVDTKAAGLSLDAAGFTDAAFLELEKSINVATPAAVAAAAAAAEPAPDVSAEPLVIGKYKLEVPAAQANRWLKELHERFNNDEVLVIAEVKKRLGLA